MRKSREGQRRGKKRKAATQKCAAAEDSKKTVHPPLKGRAEAETPQVTPSKLPYGTRTNPLSAAISLS